MALSRLAEEEGSLLEAALRRIKLQQAESAWGLRWVEGEAEDEWPEAGPFGFVVDEGGERWRRAKSEPIMASMYTRMRNVLRKRIILASYKR